MLDQDAPSESSAPTTDINTSTSNTNIVNINALNNNHNPLNDHDYCSPNKTKSQKQPDLNNTEMKSNLIDSTSAQRELLTFDEALASTSTSPGHQKLTTDQRPLHEGFSGIPENPRIDGNLSDSSSSSSLSSSGTSSKDLVIAQASSLNQNIAPVKRRPGRPPGIRKSTSDLPEQATVTSVRAKRARQSTSVTDKSEWIMGDDQIDSVLSEHLHDEPKETRRKSMREQDFAYDQHTSSEYSSSEAESDQGSDYNSEDDPERLWCLCQKPHGGKFMICCDICKDWFHGHCVGVTKLMGDRFEKEGKEWFCAECSEKLRSGIPRNAIPKKRIAKEEKKKAISTPGKRGRGRPRKTDVRDVATRSSQRTTRKSSSSLDPRTGVDNGRLKKNLARADARSDSFGDFEDSQKLKQLIRERKKSFFYKRELSAQMKAAKRNELGLGRQSLTAHLSQGLDSLASSTSTPNMSNLPINIKSEQKDKPKPNIVLQINTKKDSGSNQNDPSSRIVTAIVRSPKKSKPADPTVNDLFTADPIQISKKVKVQANNTVGQNINQLVGDTGSSNCDSGVRKRSNSSSNALKKSPPIQDHGEQSTPKKKRKDSDSTIPNGSASSPVGGSKHIARKIKESLELRCKQMKDLDISPSKIEHLAFEIEGQLNECFKEGSPKYLNKFRSLMFNLGNLKNQALVLNVLTGEISPAKLVRMSSDEMAPHELAKWRERENKHSIELIKRDAQLQAQQVIVKKTHKGEEVISAPALNEPEDPTAEVSNQEPPTTPTKHLPKEVKTEPIQSSTPPPMGSVVKSAGSLKMKITGLSSDTSFRSVNQEINDCKAKELDSAKVLTDPPIAEDMVSRELVDSIDMSTGNESDVGSADSKRKCTELEQVTEQPKRFRVSIDTKLDPANLSRLTEPLIKPAQEQATMEYEEYSPSRASPNEIPGLTDDKSHDSFIEASSDAQDQSTKSADSSPPPLPIDPSNPCWSGTINTPDTSKFSASAWPLTGSLEFMKEELPQNLMVCGRIAPDQVQSYIRKLKSTSTNHILIVQFFPLTPGDKVNFDTFFDYLYSRNRYGVIQASPQVLRDFYILPIHDKASLPEVLRPVKGPNPAIDRKDPNCLLGLLVRSKRTNNTSTSGYTPSRIK